MAQETAGTIGIPVLKNEMLPYLEYYSRRQEKAAALEAARQRKLADLEYKRQMEAEKLAVPNLPTPAGGYFTRIIDRDRQALTTGLVEAQKSGVPKGDLITMTNIGTQAIGSKDALNSFYTKQLDEEAKKLQEIGVEATPGLVQKFVDDMDQQNPKFFETFRVGDFVDYATSQSAYMNPAKIGQYLVKSSGVKPSSIDIENPQGKKESFDFLPFFKTGAVNVGGKQAVGVTGVDVPSTESYFNANPAVKKLKDVWIADRTNKLLQFDPVINKIPDPAEKQNTAKERAMQEFYDQATAGMRSNFKYGISYESTGRGGGKQKYQNLSTSQTTLQLTQTTSPGTGVSIATTSISPSKPGDLVFTIPSATNVFKASDFSSYPLPQGSLNLTDLNLGYAARDKATKKYIPPEEWKNTQLKNVEFVSGAYGTPETYQTKPVSTGNTFMAAAMSLFTKPTLLGERVFLPTGTVGAIESQAKSILASKGMNYNAVMKQNLNNMKKQFKQSRFSTKH